MKRLSGLPRGKNQQAGKTYRDNTRDGKGRGRRDMCSAGEGEDRGKQYAGRVVRGVCKSRIGLLSLELAWSWPLVGRSAQWAWEELLIGEHKN
jgi:hypothetical protein